jgi:fructose-specific phosphotransferase system IIA component
MIPRGEVALIIAGIGLASGVLDNQLFAIIILMTLVTTLAAPPLLSGSLKIAGPGTKKPVKGDDSVSAVWEFHSGEIAGLVINNLLKDLKAEGFYVQLMNIDDGLSQARKGDMVFSITEAEQIVTIETSQVDMPLVKTAMYEVILGLYDAVEKLKSSSDPKVMKQEISNLEGRTREEVLSLIEPPCIIPDLKSTTKEGIITELVDLLNLQGKILNRDEALRDVWERERTMSTGMEHGIALPHGKSEAVTDICVAVGIKKEGVDFESLDNEKSRLFILVLSPKKTSGPHIQFLAAIGSVLKDEAFREEVIDAGSKEDIALLLQRGS